MHIDDETQVEPGDVYIPPNARNLSITVAANRWCLSVLLTQLGARKMRLFIKSGGTRSSISVALVSLCAPGVCLFSRDFLAVYRL